MVDTSFLHSAISVVSELLIMVTRAGKKLLRNTIHTVDHHNKVLEEQEMWRQWELQQGLTMMVSDDAIQSRAKYLRKQMEKCLEKQEYKYSKSCNSDLHKKDVESLKRMRNYWLNQLLEAEEKDPDRWGHSGFKELYPEEFELTLSPKHSSQMKTSIRKKERKKKKHKRRSEKRNVPPTECSQDYSKNPFLEKNGTDRVKELKKCRNLQGEDEKDVSKKRKHSLTKCRKRKEKHKASSRKTENPRKHKRFRHTSESSMEEVWVEKTIENRDSKIMPENPPIVTHKLSYISNSSSDSMENNIFVDQQDRKSVV